MVRDNSWTQEPSATNDYAWIVEEGDGGTWVLEEAVDIALNNYLRVRGGGNLSVSGIGMWLLGIFAGWR